VLDDECEEMMADEMLRATGNPDTSASASVPSGGEPPSPATDGA